MIGSILFLLILFFVIIGIGNNDGDAGKKKTHYIVRSGRCPTCGSPCKWYIDPDTGNRSFHCDWCNDFNG